MQAVLKCVDADVKWVRPQSVHLTLKFLGDTPEDTIGPLAAKVAEAVASCPPVNLNIDGVGVFPNRNKPRVVWLGLGGETRELSNLHKLVECAASEFGYIPEKRAFKPHLTLGRVRSSRGKGRLMSELEKTKPRELAIEARELILFKSDLKPSGAVYTALHKLPLTGNIQA